METRRCACDNVYDNGFLDTCSVDDGVEIDKDEDELDDDDVRGKHDTSAPLDAIGFVVTIPLSDKRGSIFCLGSNDNMTSEGGFCFST